MEFTFRIYLDDTSGKTHELTTKQYAEDLNEAIDEANKILGVIEKSADVVFLIEHDYKDVAGICPEVNDWAKF